MTDVVCGIYHLLQFFFVQYFLTMNLDSQEKQIYGIESTVLLRTYLFDERQLASRTVHPEK